MLEYLSDGTVAQGGNVHPLVNLPDVSTQQEMVLDYGTAEWPRGLRVSSKDDVISITYSVCKPVVGKEYRI